MSTYTDDELEIIIRQIHIILDELFHAGVTKRKDQAKKLGIPRTYLPGILAGTHRPGEKTIKKIAKNAGKTYEWMLQKEVDTSKDIPENADISYIMNDILEILDKFPSLKYLHYFLKNNDFRRAVREAEELITELKQYDGNFQPGATELNQK